jgi:hypothetical protein
MKRFMFLGFALTSVTALLVVSVALVVTFVLQNDVEILQKKARAAARAEKGLRTDIAAIKDELAALQIRPDAVEIAETELPVVAVAPVAPESAAPAEARLIRVSAKAPSECTFRPGDSLALMDCIRREQERVVQTPRRSHYR